MPPELILVPTDWRREQFSLPPLSTVALMTVPADTSKVTPLLTVKPESVPY